MASGTPTNRTNIELPTEVSAEILQKMQDQSAIMQLARRVTLPGRGLTIPVITSVPVAEWVAETGAKPVKNPGLTKKIMQAYKLAVIVPFSKEFRRDAASLYNELVARLPLALAAKFDAACFYGQAPGSNFDVLTDTTYGSNIISINNGIYDALVTADEMIAANNGILNGFVFSPVGRSLLLGEKDQTGRPLFINSAAEGAIPMILGQKVVLSRAAYFSVMSNSLVGIAGDWTQAMYGVVNGITIEISDQATLMAKDGEDQDVMINLWQQNMFAVRAEIEVGFVADTECFTAFMATPGGATGATGATGSTG